MSEGFTRPEARVLPMESLVPPESLIRPPPNLFTHETVARTPFSYASSRGSGEDGSLSAGTKVVVLRTDEDDRRSAVVDASGLYVLVPTASLRPLPPPEA
jgi:hypothetical protein